MISILIKTLGALGLILITWGIFQKNLKQRDILYIIGGIFLFVYSVYLKDIIFSLLQAVFAFASIFHLYETKK